MGRRARRIPWEGLRTGTLFCGGFFGTMWLFVHDWSDRPALTTLAAGMMGLSFWLGRGDQRRDRDTGRDREVQ